MQAVLKEATIKKVRRLRKTTSFWHLQMLHLQVMLISFCLPMSFFPSSSFFIHPGTHNALVQALELLTKRRTAKKNTWEAYRAAPNERLFAATKILMCASRDCGWALLVISMDSTIVLVVRYFGIMLNYSPLILWYAPIFVNFWICWSLTNSERLRFAWIYLRPQSKGAVLKKQSRQELNSEHLWTLDGLLWRLVEH